MIPHALLLALLCFACNSAAPSKTTTVAPSAFTPGWSKAGRRARIRHAWHCTGQGTQTQSSTGGVFVVRPPPRTRPAGCDYVNFLCAEIARGHQAWDAERHACSDNLATGRR